MSQLTIISEQVTKGNFQYASKWLNWMQDVTQRNDDKLADQNITVSQELSGWTQIWHTAFDMW